MPGRKIPIKGKQPRYAEGTLRVLSLEVEGGYYTGGTGTAT